MLEVCGWPSLLSHEEKGLKISQDDRGIEGVIEMADQKRRKVRIGSKVSSESVKRSEFESTATRDSAREQDLKNLQPDTNSKDICRTCDPHMFKLSDYISRGKM